MPANMLLGQMCVLNHPPFNPVGCLKFMRVGIWKAFISVITLGLYILLDFVSFFGCCSGGRPHRTINDAWCGVVWVNRVKYIELMALQVN
mmetsp:Transcript_44926/g.111345  ORF Transcript_44926/g.111345 Transcript_44926/m.111345 type:complete len:90 (+) Transcript_44926:1041-1310(+)